MIRRKRKVLNKNLIIKDFQKELNDLKSECFGVEIPKSLKYVIIHITIIKINKVVNQNFIQVTSSVESSDVGS